MKSIASVFATFDAIVFAFSQNDSSSKSLFRHLLILEIGSFHVKWCKPGHDPSQNLIKFFAFLNASYPKSHLSNLSTLLILPNHMKDCQKIKKKEDLRNYFCLKIISKVAPQNLFLKIIQILEAWKPTKDIKFRLEFFCTCPSTYALHAFLHMPFIFAHALLCKNAKLYCCRLH